MPRNRHAAALAALVVAFSVAGCTQAAPEAQQAGYSRVNVAYDLVATINAQVVSMRLSPLEAPRIMAHSLLAAHAAAVLAPTGVDSESAASAAGTKVAAEMIVDETKAANIMAVNVRHGVTPDGAAAAFGARIAERVLRLAAADGHDDSLKRWSKNGSGTTEYRWEPTGRGDSGFEPGWGTITPVVSSSAACQLDSPSSSMLREQAEAMYATFSERDAVGPDVMWWLAGNGTVTPSGQWMRMAVNAAKDNKLSAADALELLAKAAVAANDAAILAWREKYRHNVARPESLWELLHGSEAPLLPRETPNHPSYPSGHSVFGAAVATVVIDTLGDVSTRDSFLPDLYAPAETRRWRSMSEALAEAGASRVHAGFHYPLDVSAGQELGECVAVSVLGSFSKVVSLLAQ